MGQSEEKTLPREEGEGEGEGGGAVREEMKAWTAEHSVHFIFTHKWFAIAEKKIPKKINKQEQHEQLKILEVCFIKSSQK